MSLLVVGSVALDSVKTPCGKRNNILGGSATFASLAASFFCKVSIVATVGEDFPKQYVSLFKNMGIGLEGFKIANGKTFRWEGEYSDDMSRAKTLSTHLNVFKDFNPSIPRDLRNTKYIFLANIDPDLQYNVLKQMDRPKVVACDSMNYWIDNKRKSFEKLLGNVDLLLLNDSEARQLSGEENIAKAARFIVAVGPKAVIIKRAEHGAIYVSRKSVFIAPSYLVETLCDPTGAGDTFAGALMGYLSKVGKTDEPSIKKAMIYANAMASFAIEDFSVNRLLELTYKEMEKRVKVIRDMVKI